MICRSKRPGRSSAGSSTSGRLVAASTTTPSWPEKPSISVRIWFSVCSRSSWPPIARAPPRARPMVSISSMKMIAGATLRASREQLAHAAGADADDHLDELGGAGAEERHLGLAGGGAREQRLAGARRPGQQHALGRARAEAPVLLGVLEEVDDLVDLGLDLVDAGDVLERDAHRLGIDALLLAAAEEPAHRALLAPEHPDVEREQQQDRARTRSSRLVRKPRCCTSGVARTVAPLVVSSPSRSSFANVGRSVVNCW